MAKFDRCILFGAHSQMTRLLILLRLNFFWMLTVEVSLKSVIEMFGIIRKSPHQYNKLHLFTLTFLTLQLQLHYLAAPFIRVAFANSSWTAAVVGLPCWLRHHSRKQYCINKTLFCSTNCRSKRGSFAGMVDDGRSGLLLLVPSGCRLPSHELDANSLLKLA